MKAEEIFEKSVKVMKEILTPEGMIASIKQGQKQDRGREPRVAHKRA